MAINPYYWVDEIPYVKLPGSIVHVCPFVKVVGLHTLLAKAVGIVFSVSAGLPCGKAWDLRKKMERICSGTYEILLMEEILHQLIWRIYQCWQCFIGPRWLFGISAINSRALKKIWKRYFRIGKLAIFSMFTLILLVMFIYSTGISCRNPHGPMASPSCHRKGLWFIVVQSLERTFGWNFSKTIASWGINNPYTGMSMEVSN